jgi:imidazolonepropionase-like amidohydrolase
VIERGAVVVRDGKIRVGLGGRPAHRGRRAADSTRRAARFMPGFIDAHRHIVQGNGKEWLDKTAAPRSCRSSSTPASRPCLCAICPDEASRCGSGSRRAP